MGKPTIDIDAIRGYEERGLALINKHRKEIIRLASKPGDYFFEHMFRAHVHEPKKGRRYIYIPNDDSQVLAVAHLDTVKCPKKDGFSFNRYVDKHGLEAIKMTTVDDRLGLAIILLVLPELGINVDVLLTDLEESSQSTAEEFKTDKVYNHIVQFDRAGSAVGGTYNDNDVVLYDFWDKDWVKTLRDAGFQNPGHGTFTDIGHLQSLKTKAMNIAIGYYENHTSKAWFRVGEWMRAIDLYAKFYSEHGNTRFEHEEVVRQQRIHQYSVQKYEDWAVYKRGQVVMTSQYGRHDNKPQIGYLSDQPRGQYWVVADRDNYVVDVVLSNHIVKAFKCPNCKMDVTYLPGDYLWHAHGNRVFCGKCWQVAKLFPDIIINAIATKNKVSIADTVFTVFSVYRDSESKECFVLGKDTDGEVVIETLEAANEAVKYEPSETIVVVNDAYLDIDVTKTAWIVIAEEDDVYEIQDSSGTNKLTWIIPKYIFDKVTEGEITHA